MSKLPFCAAMGILMIVFSCSVVNSQQNASSDAFAKWKSRAIAKAGDSKISYEAFAVSTQRLNENEVVVQVSLGASLDRQTVEPALISTQLVSINGEMVEILGSSSKIQSGQIVRDFNERNEIVFHPTITLRNQPRANGVRVTINGWNGSSEPATLVVPLSTALSTSVLGRVELASQTQGPSATDEACTWWVGYCDTCTLCVGCSNNSPSLNCVNCTMDCSGDPTCTPTGPKPFDCP